MTVALSHAFVVRRFARRLARSASSLSAPAVIALPSTFREFGTGSRSVCRARASSVVSSSGAFPRNAARFGFRPGRPRYCGHLTNNIIYDRLAPKVREELLKVTPRRPKGRLKHHLHRRLTDEVGHPKLREHLASVTTIMKLSND
jgi:P63C domain